MFIRLDGDIITVTDPIDTVTTLHAFHIHQYSEWTVLQFGAYKPMFDENGPIHRQGKAVPLPENVLDYVADLPLPNTL
jgi:hypothetical protein